jgi:hypothetical protein
MFGWLFKNRVPSSEAGIGVEPYDWQPNRLVVPTYALNRRDEPEWIEFLKRTTNSASFQMLKVFDPLRDEPKKADLDPDIHYWARVGNELWFLADRDWFGFPDPQQYALLVWNRSKKRLTQLGNFGRLPDSWTLPDASN